MRYFYLLLVTILISSCASGYYEVYEVHTPCQKYTSNHIFDQLQKSLARQDFNITELDYGLGLMVAETEPEYGDYSYRSYRKQWKFMVDERGTIIAKARIIETRTNDMGVITYEQSYFMGDQTHPKNRWYWDVRYAMENICDNASTSYVYERASAVIGENEEKTAAFILGVTAIAIDAALEANDD